MQEAKQYIPVDVPEPKRLAGAERQQEIAHYQ